MNAPCPSRIGFTAIELVIAVSIMVILTGLAAPTVFASLRRSQVQRGAVLVAEMARQAQQLALQGLAPAGGEHHGVALVHDPAEGPGAYVTLIYGKPTSGGRMRDLWDHPNPKPERILERLPASLSVMSSGQALNQQPVTEVVWFYSWRTGMPLAPSGSGFATGQASVGLKSLSYANAWGLGTTITAPVVSPATGGEPGLCLQSADGSLRRGLQVYPSGLFEIVNLETR